MRINRLTSPPMLAVAGALPTDGHQRTMRHRYRWDRIDGALFGV
jgi:hypothetical protein